VPIAEGWGRDVRFESQKWSRRGGINKDTAGESEYRSRGEFDRPIIMKLRKCGPWVGPFGEKPGKRRSKRVEGSWTPGLGNRIYQALKIGGGGSVDYHPPEPRECGDDDRFRLSEGPQHVSHTTNPVAELYSGGVMMNKAAA